MKGFMTVVLMIFSFLASVRAGGMASGGGKGIVCFSDISITAQVRSRLGVVFDEDLPYITSIEAQDLRYARQARGPLGLHRPLLPLEEGQEFSDYLDQILARLKTLRPDLYKRVAFYRERWETGEKSLLRDSPLEPIHDDGDVAHFQSAHCTLTTMAAQFNIGNAVHMHLDARLFNHPQHSDWSKAVLLLHEYLYALSREKGALNSRDAREFLAVLLIKDDILMAAQLDLALGEAPLLLSMLN